MARTVDERALGYRLQEQNHQPARPPGLAPIARVGLNFLQGKQFQQIWCADFEFGQSSNLTPAVRCLVAREYYSGRLVRLWLDGVAKPVCPLPMGENSFYAAYYASAEMGCHLTLDWSFPN